VGDDPQLQQVVMNLVTNASEALGEKPGLITLTTRWRECDAEFLAKTQISDQLTAGTYVELEVRDSGCGMDETTRAKLFDPFFSTKFTGRGLGMSVVMGVVRGHKGAILVSSQLNRGTAVSVLFPATACRHTAMPAAQRPVANPPAAPMPLSGTVLVVEDEASLRLLMERILKRLGLRVLTAEDGAEGVAIFQQRAPEITFAIVDFTMPKLDGIKTLAEFRKVKPDVKAVLTSGYDVESFSQNYAKDGFAAFLRKPFQVEMLVTVARELCAPA